MAAMESSYSSWQSLEDSIAAMVRGKRIAMEYSAGDAVPYLDRVPAGLIEMVRAAGATSISSSGEAGRRFQAVCATRQTPAPAPAADGSTQIARDPVPF